ncbi:MAG: DUF6365 family protein [Myxococcota bacterium]
MASRLRVLVLGCSSVTTGELTMAMELLSRCRRPLEVHALVGTSLAGLAKWYGARVHVYPTLGMGLAFAKIENTVRTLRPDVILVADMLLMYGLSPEFAGRLSGLVPEALSISRVVALDLYDFPRTALDVDIFGRPMLTQMPYIPAELGRVQPCPSLPPQRSVPGVGRYAMMDDAGPMPQYARKQLRAELQIGDGEAMVVITTSTWQHRLAQHPEAGAVATHFPALMYELLAQAARASRLVHVVHVGAMPLPPPDGTGLRYQHHASMPPDNFRRVLGAADLYLTPNCPASTTVRAMSLRVPVATLYASGAPPERGTGTPAGGALERYLDDTRGGFPFYLWPVGMHGMLEQVLLDNPFVDAQRILDIHLPNRAVEEIATLLRGGAEVDALRGAEEELFGQLMSHVDSPDDALASALWERE